MKKLSLITKIILAIICACPVKSSAQYECSVQHFSASNGLLQHAIIGIAFDKAGYLWLGTKAGLIRYDGVNFRTYLSDSSKTEANDSNTVANISVMPSDKNVLATMKGGLSYTIVNGKPLLQRRNSEINLLLPVSNNELIKLSETGDKVFFVKNGIQQKEIKVNGHFKSFIKSKQSNLIVDDKFNLQLFDAKSFSFNEILVEWPDEKKPINNTSLPFFLWDKNNDESYCFFNSVFYLLHVDSINHRIKFIPRFSLKEEGHFWTGVAYDSINSTYFLSSLTEGLFQIKLKRIQTIPLNENNVSIVNAHGYALLKTSDSTLLTADGLELTSKGNRKYIWQKKGNISGNRETIANLGDTAILCAQQNKLVYYSKADGYKQSHIFNESFNRDYRSFITLLQPEGDSVWVCSDIGIFSLRKNEVKVILSRSRDEQSLYFGLRLFYRLSKDEVLYSNNLGLFQLKTSPPYTIDSFPDMKDKQISCIAKYQDALLLAVYKYGLFVLKNNILKKCR